MRRLNTIEADHKGDLDMYISVAFDGILYKYYYRDVYVNVHYNPIRYGAAVTARHGIAHTGRDDDNEK